MSSTQRGVVCCLRQNPPIYPACAIVIKEYEFQGASRANCWYTYISNKILSNDRDSEVIYAVTTLQRLLSNHPIAKMCVYRGLKAGQCKL